MPAVVQPDSSNSSAFTSRSKVSEIVSGWLGAEFVRQDVAPVFICTLTSRQLLGCVTRPRDRRSAASDASNGIEHSPAFVFGVEAIALPSMTTRVGRDLDGASFKVDRVPPETAQLPAPDPSSEQECPSDRQTILRRRREEFPGIGHRPRLHGFGSCSWSTEAGDRFATNSPFSTAEAQALLSFKTAT
jgi:hypothetical protein